MLVANPAQAVTPRILHTALPTTVPIPRSDSVRYVPITLTNISGAQVAVAMNVAPATSGDRCKSVNLNQSDKFSINYLNFMLKFVDIRKSRPKFPFIVICEPRS